MTAHDVAIAGSGAVREAQARQRAASRIDRPYSKESMAENLLKKTRSGGILIQMSLVLLEAF
jgi:hypothetical protein